MIRVGDRVKVIQEGRRYTTHKGFFRENNLSTRISNRYPSTNSSGPYNGDLCTVIFISEKPVQIVVVELKDGSIGLIGLDGLEIHKLKYMTIGNTSIKVTTENRDKIIEFASQFDGAEE
jgi:hypothetical protein